MPRIFDNINLPLLPTLKNTLAVSYRADFCVGYFNLRGWQQIDEKVNEWTGGEGYCCRLLVGMQRLPQETLQEALSLTISEERITNQRALQLRKELAQEFRRQLTLGAPTNADEAGLRRLAQQIRDGKLVVKLFLRHPLHAKLYLLFREDIAAPTIGYMGSSNLTFSGLAGQGELNIDVLDQDACNKLAQWFNDRWQDRFCLDLSKEIVEIIEESWAGVKVIPPYYIYLKMAYHLSREAREGLSEFTIPSQFAGQLFDFQKAAVQIGARYLNQRGGVLIGDVVGLGKTMMATAIAKITVAPGAPAYPAPCATHPTHAAPATLHCWGQPVWQAMTTLALFCSAKAPAGVLLAVHDLAQQWRIAGPLLMGGFQSTVEEEALTILLRGPRPVVVWLARGMVKRPPLAWQAALAAGRLTLVAPFPEHLRRATAETAVVRNRLVAAAADAVLFAHAQPGSKTAQLAQEVLGWGKPVYMVDHPANEPLRQMGMAVLGADTVIPNRRLGVNSPPGGEPTGLVSNAPSTGLACG